MDLDYVPAAACQKMIMQSFLANLHPFTEMHTIESNLIKNDLVARIIDIESTPRCIGVRFSSTTKVLECMDTFSAKFEVKQFYFTKKGIHDAVICIQARRPRKT